MVGLVHDMPDVPTQDHDLVHLGHDQLLGVGSLGLEVSRRGFLQGDFVQLYIGQQPLEPSVVFFRFLEPFGLVGPQTTVFLTPTVNTSVP